MNSLDEKKIHIKSPAIKPWTRVFILISSLLALAAISFYLTGSILPETPEYSLVFQNALLLVILGSAFIEHKFTKPADSVVNSLMGMITLITVYRRVSALSWWVVFAYCGMVFILSAICTAVSTGKEITGWREKAARLTYRPSVLLGGARRLFSILFLFGVFSFFGSTSLETAVLVLFWGLFVVIWPLGIPELLSAWSTTKRSQDILGKIVRTDWPNLVRVTLDPSVNWSHSNLKIYQQPDGVQQRVLPLYSQTQGEQLLGTGLCVAKVEELISGLEPGFIYEDPNPVPNPDSYIASQLGGSSTSRLVGFIVEESDIGQIKFEIWDPSSCHEGMLVWCKLADEKIYYQITNGITHEEVLASDRHGFQIAMAAQLGVLAESKGFRKYGWVPPMNTPIFSEQKSFGENINTGVESDFLYGHIPGSSIRIMGPFDRAFDHHTAILGVTGSGKTELAFDLIRYAVSKGIKVLCIDLTAKYEGRLVDLKPKDLSIPHDMAQELSQKLFDVESGTYGSGPEKKILKEYSIKLREVISKEISVFLSSKEEKDKVGIIKLEEISNTKATLYITELYLTCLLHYAKDNQGECPKVLIVVEEAHTVMPEPSTMGLGDYDSRGLVGKISQIALQGRKYGVGLLVIAQRTATVSKTVLTQCNTIISFTCFDDTSLGFLRNIFGAAHIALIPNLAPLQAVIFGRAVRSERPIVVEIPFDMKKVDGGA